MQLFYIESCSLVLFIKFSILAGYIRVFSCIFNGQFRFRFIFILICLVSHTCSGAFQSMLADLGLWFVAVLVAILTTCLDIVQVYGKGHICFVTGNEYFVFEAIAQDIGQV